MVEEKFCIIQPTHVDKRLIPEDAEWGNDSFNNLSRLFQARLYHITQDDIDLDADIYFLINFDIELIDREIEFLRIVKGRGAKTIVGFSQDRRYLIGKGLINNRGTSYMDLCEVADAVGSGIPSHLRMYGRYQDKVISWGEILEDIDFSIPYEERDIDFLCSGALNGNTLAFELETCLMIKEKYPEKKVVLCVPDSVECKSSVIQKYPQIEFPSSKTSSLLDHMKKAKVYCNLEVRPRPARTLIEAYYCKVPFISSSNTYFSRLCEGYTYNTNSIKNIFDLYELLQHKNYDYMMRIMECNAEYDKFDAVYKRIKNKLKI